MTERFHYTVPDTDQTVELPHFKHIPFGVIRKLRNENEGEQLFGLIEHVADEDTLEVLDGLDMAQIDALFDAWQEASTMTAGESSAS